MYWPLSPDDSDLAEVNNWDRMQLPVVLQVEEDRFNRQRGRSSIAQRDRRRHSFPQFTSIPGNINVRTGLGNDRVISSQVTNVQWSIIGAVRKDDATTGRRQLRSRDPLEYSFNYCVLRDLEI